MTLFPQTDCCTLLGIDPKTLRHWLREANMPFATHPSDARLKCLTQAQIQQLAAQQVVLQKGRC
jgi:predicted site-specific integrase-resolvase